jgi:hypothetical protein
MHARLSALAVGVFLTIFGDVGLCAEPLARIVVEAGQFARTETPVSVPLPTVPEAMANVPLSLHEVRGSTRTAVPAQVEAGTPPRLHWTLVGTLPAGQQRVYELVAGGASADRVVTADKDAKNLEVAVGDKRVLRYHHAIVPPPAGQSELYNRSAFIHPMWSPAGTVLTNIHPDDHYHHVGIWMPWTHTEFKGKPTDFWNLKGGQGTVRFVKYLSTTSGPVYGGFRANQHHVALQTDVGQEIVLDEVWDVRVYNVGGPEKGYWLWDFTSTQRNVADSVLKQVQYRYGGFGYRGAAEWDEDNAAYLTSEGKNRKNGHATRARWCDMGGSIDGKWEGVTMYSHPKNFRHPEPMRIWPKGQVFFNWAPGQIGDWAMKPGEDHVFRYRIYVHEGRIDVAEAERIWNDYANPPGIEVEAHQPENAIVLFDGSDFSHWQRQDGGDVRWKITDDGAMQVVPKSGSIMTRRDVGDFMLHVEFKTPQMPPNVKGQGRGNSGVYIQRRYEVQILDSFGEEPTYNGCGSLYRTRAPDRNVSRRPGQWQSYDILFQAARFSGEAKCRDARITVLHNGVPIHDDVAIPNKTGAGKPEGPDPAPILLQDHGNEVSFRNIWILPLN